MTKEPQTVINTTFAEVKLGKKAQDKKLVEKTIVALVAFVGMCGALYYGLWQMVHP